MERRGIQGTIRKYKSSNCNKTMKLPKLKKINYLKRENTTWNTEITGRKRKTLYDYRIPTDKCRRNDKITKKNFAASNGLF